VGEIRVNKAWLICITTMEDLKDSIWKKEKFQRTGKHQSALKSYTLQIRKYVGFVVMVHVTNQSHRKKMN